MCRRRPPTRPSARCSLAQLLAAAEPIAIQATLDPDGGQAILQVEQGGIPGNKATNKVVQLNVLNVLPAATAEGAVGLFVDDEGFGASAAAFIATSVGAAGPVVNGLVTWLDSDEADAFPPCPAQCVTPDNGPPPTDLPAEHLGRRAGGDPLRPVHPGPLRRRHQLHRLVLPVVGPVGHPGAPVPRLLGALRRPGGRRDIENLTQAAAVDVPVIAFGGSNGLAPVPGNFIPFATSIGACAAASCDGTTPRVVDAASPSAAFPTFGGAPGGFEVFVTEGYAHVDPLAAEDGTGNNVVGPLAEFLIRNSP